MHISTLVSRRLDRERANAEQLRQDEEERRREQRERAEREKEKKLKEEYQRKMEELKVKKAEEDARRKGAHAQPLTHVLFFLSVMSMLTCALQRRKSGGVRRRGRWGSGRRDVGGRKP